jgi:ParB family chromosome partitioning protein
VSNRRGLPSGLVMRHTAHYVEELAEGRPTPIGRLIATELLEPNPEQPRVELGDLTELTASVKEKGVLEPLLVVPSRKGGGRWMIVAGERRWRAATAAGVREVPCVVLEADERTVAEIALIENMQRKDLTVWEEADGLLALCERFGYTHEDVARKVGKSRTTVTEAMAIAALPAQVREACQRAGISAKSTLLEIARQPTDEMMSALIEDVRTGRLTREQTRMARRARNEPGTPIAPRRKSNLFQFQSADGEFELELKFKRRAATRAEIEKALRAVLREIESGAARAEDA